MVLGMHFFPALLSLLACGASESEDSGERTGACGEPSEVDLVLRVAVQDSEGNPLQDIDVVLEDRGWKNESLGGGITDGDGEVEFEALGVTDLPDCWGTMLDYVVLATDTRGDWSSGEKSANSYLHTAIENATMEADMRAFPLVLQPAEEAR